MDYFMFDWRRREINLGFRTCTAALIARLHIFYVSLAGFLKLQMLVLSYHHSLLL